MTDGIPSFDDPEVLAAIERETAAWQESHGDYPLTDSIEEMEDAPLVEYHDIPPQDDGLGLVQINVMHNGEPAVRTFRASNAAPS